MTVALVLQRQFLSRPAGRDKFFEHVKSYELAFSKDGHRWNYYKENGRTRVSEEDWKSLKVLFGCRLSPRRVSLCVCCCCFARYYPGIVTTSPLWLTD